MKKVLSVLTAIALALSLVLPLVPAVPVTAAVNYNATYTHNVKNYGAKGDGKTDDTAAIQGLLDKLAAGNTVFFPSGTYLVSSPLRFPDGVHIIGVPASSGIGGSVIKATKSMEYMLGSKGRFWKCTVANLTLDGGKAAGCRVGALMNMPDFLGNRMANLKLQNSTGDGVYTEVGTGVFPTWIAFIENIEVTNVDGWAMYMINSDTAFNHVTVNGGKGIMDYNYGGNVYNDIHVSNSTGSGLTLGREELDENGMIAIMNSTFTDNARYGLQLDRPAYGDKHVTVEGCDFSGNKVADVGVKYVQKSNFYNCNFRSATPFGFADLAAEIVVNASHFACASFARPGFSMGDNTFKVTSFSNKGCALDKDRYNYAKVYKAWAMQCDSGKVVNVADFGAVSSSSVSSSAAFQAAIEAVRSTGGIVFVPQGDYSFSETVNIPSNVTIMGAGSHLTVTYAPLNGLQTLFRIEDNAKNVLITNGVYTNPQKVMLSHFITATGVSGCQFDQLEGNMKAVYSVGNVFQLTNASNCSFNSVSAGVTDGGDIIQLKNCTDCLIQTSYISRGSRGTVIDGGSGHTIMNNHYDLFYVTAVEFKNGANHCDYMNNYNDMNQRVLTFNYDTPTHAFVTVSSCISRESGVTINNQLMSSTQENRELPEIYLRNTKNVNIFGFNSAIWKKETSINNAMVEATGDTSLIGIFGCIVGKMFIGDLGANSNRNYNLETKVTEPLYGAGQITATNSWTYGGCTWEGINSGFGHITADTFVSFDVDFGAAGCNTFTVGAAEAYEDWKYQVYVDDVPVGIASGKAGGGWTTAHVTTDTHFMSTYTGIHNVKLRPLPNSAGHYMGNLLSVTFKRTTPFPAMHWSILPVSQQAYWLSDATLETPSANAGNGNDNDDKNYGGFGDHEKYAEALMDFGTSAVDSLFIYMAQPAVASVAKVYIDDVYVGQAALSAATGSYTTGAEARIDLGMALSGVHRVKVTTHAANLFYIRPHTHDTTGGTCTVATNCQWCGVSVKAPHAYVVSCASADYCVFCGAVGGAAKGHAWVAATCTSPKRCAVCGATEGSAKGHTWAAATCITPKRCTTCGLLEGSAKGHTSTKGGSFAEHTQCSTCSAPLSVDHSYTKTTQTAATCTTKGTSKYTCSCGYSYTSQDIPALGHASVNGGTAGVHTKCSRCNTTLSSTHSYTKTTQTAATCTAKGTSKYTCSCGYSYTSQDIPALGHASVNGGTSGAHTKCSRCNTTLSSTHSYTKTTQTAATCTAKGTSKYTCSCGYSYTSQDIPALGHASVNGGTSGAHTKCSRCNTTLSSTHSYTKTTQTAATCTAKGTSKYTCSCGYSYTSQDIPALGHASVNGGTSGAHTKCKTCGTTLSTSHSYSSSVTKEATCTATGVKTYTCSCGYSYTETIAATGHTPGAAATCTAPQTCTVCKAQLAAATGHTEVTDPAVAPTCTATGLTAGKHCSVCGTVTVAQTVVAAKGHSYNAVVTAPTCTEDGYTTYTCSVCGDSYVADEVAAKGHSYNAVVTAPTCTAEGYTTYTCSVCGDSYVADEVAAKGHSYNAVVTAPTCTEDGYTTYTCSVCDDSYVADEVAANGHAYNAVVTAPTCTEDGYTTYTCSVCDHSYVADEVAATGHNWLEATCTQPAICSDCGEMTGEALGHSFENGVCLRCDKALADTDGDGTLDSNDAVYLLYHTMLPEQYPLADGDVNGDGTVDGDDAIYLLYHVLLPDLYPL